MAEKSRETDDAEVQGVEDTNRFLSYVVSFFATKPTEEKPSGKTGKKVKQGLMATFVGFVLQVCSFVAVEGGWMSEDDLQTLSQLLYNFDPQCLIEYLVKFSDLLRDLHMAPVYGIDMAANFGAHVIRLYFGFESELCPVLLAIFLQALLLITCKWIWGKICVEFTKTHFLSAIKFFSACRRTLLCLGFVASAALIFWQELKKELECLDPNQIFNTDAKTPWICVFVTQGHSVSLSLLSLSTVYTLYVWSWKEPGEHFHKQLLVILRVKCMTTLYIHCIARSFDRWSCFALVVVFIYWCKIFIALVNGERKGIKNWILPVFPCFVSVKFGMVFFGATLMIGIVQMVMSTNSMKKEENKKCKGVLKRIWWTELFVSFRP
jgi:hypothetical protein